MANPRFLESLLEKYNRRIEKADHGTTRRRRLKRKRDELRRALARAEGRA